MSTLGCQVALQNRSSRGHRSTSNRQHHWGAINEYAMCWKMPAAETLHSRHAARALWSPREWGMSKPVDPCAMLTGRQSATGFACAWPFSEQAQLSQLKCHGPSIIGCRTHVQSRRRDNRIPTISNEDFVDAQSMGGCMFYLEGKDKWVLGREGGST